MQLKACFLRAVGGFSKRYSSSSTYFLTTPIFYANGPPHIGHLYTGVLADASHRWQKMKNPNLETVFSTGVDEHGTKIQQAAQLAKIPPYEFCTKISTLFQKMFFRFDVNATCFIRTTEKRHVEAVHHFWSTLQKNGFIYKSDYGGWYSSIDETFYSESEVTDAPGADGSIMKVSTATGNRVEYTKETNYMFRLSAFKAKLRDWLTQSEIIHPTVYLPACLSLLDNPGFGDLSVSREAKRVSWAIDVPGDETQKIYVWLDALVNYLTVVGYPNMDSSPFWPPDCQLLGLDILRFHALVWPALLMAVGLPLPKKLFVHNHWQVDHVKMSKSRGNVVDPMSECNFTTADGLRYFLLRQGVPHEETSYSRRKAIHLINDELANNLGNLVTRSMGKKMNAVQEFPPFYSELFQRDYADDGISLVKGLHYMSDQVAEHYDHLYFYKGIQLIQNALRQTNSFYQYHAPWTNVDADGVPLSVDDEQKLHTTIHVTYQALRLCALLLQPITPQISAKLLSRLNVPEDERTFAHCRVFEKCPTTLERRPLGSRLASGDRLFQKLPGGE